MEIAPGMTVPADLSTCVAIRSHEPIKSIGMFTVPIKLHPEIVAQLKVWVVQE